MQPVLDQLSGTLGDLMPDLLRALAILIVGWLAAYVVSSLVRSGLKRADLDGRLARWTGAERGARRPEAERWIARGVYYLILIAVLIAFLQSLRLTVTDEPVRQLLTQLLEFGPRLLGGALLLLVAWILATVLRQAVSGLLRLAKLDERLGGRAGLEKGERAPISATLATATYWVVFLLFLPAVLGALALEGLLGPVRGMTDKILLFLPNLFASALALVLGWFVARIVQRIVTNLLQATGADRLGERIGLDKAFGAVSLSGLLGLIAYVLILVPVVITSLGALQLDTITRPAVDMLASILAAVPSIFAAVLLLVLAYAVGRFLAGLATSLLTGAGFDALMARLGLARAEGKGDPTPSSIAGYLTLVMVMLFAAIEAARLLGFATLAGLMARFTIFAGQVILGLIVFGVGLYVARVAALTVRSSGASQAPLLAAAARVSIVVLAGAIALNQMGLGDEIIRMAFGIVLGAVAVAAALAFGLGGRDVAARRLQRWLEAMEK